MQGRLLVDGQCGCGLHFAPDILRLALLSIFPWNCGHKAMVTTTSHSHVNGTTTEPVMPIVLLIQLHMDDSEQGGEAGLPASRAAKVFV